MRVSSLINGSNPRTIYRSCTSSSARLPNQLGVSDRALGAQLSLHAVTGLLKTLKWPQALDQLLREIGPSLG